MTPPVLALLAMASSPGGQAGLAPFLFELCIIVAIFYFLLIRPQQKQRRQHEDSISNIKKGDEVVTAGGIVGEVVHIKETVQQDGTNRRTMEDRITLKSGESRLVVERGRIAKILAGTGSPKS